MSRDRAHPHDIHGLDLEPPPGSPAKLRLVSVAATSFKAMAFVPVAASTIRTWY